jgi:archaellin
MKKNYFLFFLYLIMLCSKIVLAQLNHFTPVAQTGNSDAVVIQNATIDATPIISGDEIAVFDDTLCVGAGTFTGSYPLTITAWIEYEPPGQDKLPGAECDKPMIFKLWQQSSDTEIEGSPTYVIGGKFCEPVTVVSLLAAKKISQLTLIISDATGGENIGMMNFTVFLSAPSVSEVSVNYQTFDGTAVAPDDYTTTSGVLSFPAGNTIASIYVPIIDDNDHETNESFSVKLDNPVNAIIIKNEGIATITDNDATAVNMFNRESPSDYELSQNYPNPFNPETTIHFQIGEGCEINLVIYNMEGKLIRHLISEHTNAGNYKLSWDGRDEKNQPVTSGVYLYQLNAGKFSEMKKMLLIK